MLREKLEKNREADKKRRLKKQLMRTKYGHTRMRHARRGVLSCIKSGMAMFLFLLLITNSYVKKGDIGFIMGIMGLITLYLSANGLYTGLQGLKEKDKNYTTCKVGIAMGGGLLLCMCAIFIRGLF